MPAPSNAISLPLNLIFIQLFIATNLFFVKLHDQNKQVSTEYPLHKFCFPNAFIYMQEKTCMPTIKCFIQFIIGKVIIHEFLKKIQCILF